MKTQNFDTLDVVRLEVGQRPSVTGGTDNVVKNPSGVLGGWGWTTPFTFTTLTSSQDFADPNLDPQVGAINLQMATTVDNSEVRTEPAPAAPGQRWRAAVVQAAKVNAVTTPGAVAVFIRFLDAAGAVVATGNPYTGANSSTANGTRLLSSVATAPAGTAYVVLVIQHGASTDLRTWRFRQAMLCQVASADNTAAMPAYVDPYVFTDILAPAHRIEVDRPGNLQLGTLKATILDPDLDPAVSALIRPGNPVRLMALPTDPARVNYPGWSPLFVGELLNGTTEYDLTHPDESKRARIQLTAVDATRNLGNTTQPVGVASVAELNYLAEGAGVPYGTNEDSRQLNGFVTMRSNNENASLLDQVAITRDSLRGLARVTRHGRLEVEDATRVANGNRSIRYSTFTEDDYLKDFAVDFDTSRCINEVTVKELTLDEEGKTVETIYGPFRDETSIRTWGRFAQEFTRQTGTGVTVEAYASAILAANATPARAVKSLSFRVLEAGALNTGEGDFRIGFSPTDFTFRRRVFLDLHDKIHVVNARAGIDQDLRVASIRHTITPKRWDVELGFQQAAGVSIPVSTAPLPQQNERAAWTYFPATAAGWTGGIKLMIREGIVFAHLDVMKPGGTQAVNEFVLNIPAKYWPPDYWPIPCMNSAIDNSPNTAYANHLNGNIQIGQSFAFAGGSHLGGTSWPAP